MIVFEDIIQTASEQVGVVNTNQTLHAQRHSTPFVWLIWTFIEAISGPAPGPVHKWQGTVDLKVINVFIDVTTRYIFLFVMKRYPLY